MAARHKGSHKPRHHTQAKKTDRIVILEPLPVTIDTATNSSPSHTETTQTAANEGTVATASSEA